ncbi:macrophage migration inhibitory factor isoform X3 [Boleophthalmus pectinirostris]|nr:macrophage migration inhibitory factor isoform X3 [Boleophthalmus pectinirostris]
MDTLLANAVHEIAKIFESSLSQHQAELLEKTNEITILRGELEKVQRKCTEEPTSERGLCVKQEPSTVDFSGRRNITLITRVSCQFWCPIFSVLCTDEDHGLYLNLSGIKTESQESPGREEAGESKLEQYGSQCLASATIQVLEMELNQQMKMFSPAQCKDEVPDRDESIHTAAQLNAEEASSLLSISPKVCSDTRQTEGWVPGLSSTQNSTVENYKANESNCPGPMKRNTVFGLDETCLEDNYATFLEHKSANLTSSHQIAQSAQRSDNELTSHTKQGPTFGSRDRPQSNFHTFALRNMELQSLTHRPSASLVNRRPYTCPYCGKFFTYPSHQRQHLLCHTGVRLPLCQFCEKRFLTQSELTAHTCTYKGERPFGCGQCGRHFARSRNLRAHQRNVHLGKRPFTCTECGQRFAHKGNLRVHKHRVHNGLHLQQTQIGSDTV